MKKYISNFLLITVFSFVVVFMCAYGCTNPSNSEIVINSRSAFSGETSVRVITIDECEYLSGYRILTHKGNCINTFHNNK